MKFQIQRVPVTFTVTMSTMLLVISQLIRSWQKGRHLLMKLLLPDIPKDKFTTLWLKTNHILSEPIFLKVYYEFWSKASGILLLSYNTWISLPPAPAAGLVSSLKTLHILRHVTFCFQFTHLKIRLISIPKLVVTSHNKLVPKKVQLKH